MLGVTVYLKTLGETKVYTDVNGEIRLNKSNY